MKAILMTQYGDIASSLQLSDTEQPKISDNELLIKVHAASINPIDYKVLRGDFKAMKKIDFPAGIGRDVSGVVEAIGQNVSNFKVGDEVYSRVDEDNVGTLAEYVAANQDHVALKPQSLSHEEAASIPLVGLTSHQALLDIANIKAGEKVLIHAGSGGIGSLAIQIAKKQGAFVATTTSTSNVEWMKSLGADVVIDYRQQNYLEELTDYDVVYDTLGGQYTKDAFSILKSGGRVVSISGEIDDKTAQEMGLNWLIRGLLALKARSITKAAKKKSALYQFILMKSNGQQLESLAQALDSGEIKPVIDRHFDLNNAKEAFQYLSTGRAKGKVIITMGLN